MKTKTIFSIPLILAIAGIAYFFICKPKPEPQPEPPKYEVVTREFLPAAFDFEPSMGVDISEDNLAFWRMANGINGVASLNWTDSGKAVFYTTLRKTKIDVFPNLSIALDAKTFIAISPLDTFATFVSDSMYLHPGQLDFSFVPDNENVESGVNIYLKKVKVVYLRRVNP